MQWGKINSKGRLLTQGSPVDALHSKLLAAGEATKVQKLANNEQANFQCAK